MAVKIFFLLAFATVNSEVVSAFGWSTTKGLPSGCAEACTNLQVTAIAIPDYAFDDMSKVDVNSKLKNPLDVIVTINQMPTCNKIATSKLVNSCHFPQDKHSTFESISNYYAANLAICELHDAGVNYPTSCDLFAPPADMPTKLSVDELFSSDKLDNQAFSFQSFSASTKHLADKCVKALSSKAQWWTSFSNNKQNAYQICYAYRSDIERDALMATVAAMASKTNDLDMKLFASISSAQQMLDILFSLRQESAGTSEAVSELLDALTKSLETAHVKLTDDTRKGMLALVEYQEDTINKFAESRNALQEVALEVTRIWQDMQIAGLSVSQLSLNLDKLVTDVDMASLAIQASAANASSNLAFISTHIDNISGPITTASTWINGLTGSWLWKLGTDSEAMAKISQSALHATACFCLAVPLIHHDTSFGILGSVVTSFGCSLFIFGWAMGAQDFTRDSWVSLASAFAAGAALVEYLRRALRSDGWVVGLGRSVLGWW